MPPQPKKKRAPRMKNKSVGASDVVVSAPPAVPAWFAWAVSEQPEQSLMVDVDSRKIHVLRWGASSAKRPLIFVHGGGASNAWYKFIAPFFAADYDCAALSMSGCGESDWAASYSTADWAQEILAVCRSLDYFSPRRQGKPLVVAHSLGTYIALNALSLSGSFFEGLVLVDVAVRAEQEAIAVNKTILRTRATDPMAQIRAGWNVNPPDVAPVERFKLKPFQQCDNHYILKFIADSSAKWLGNDEGWIWKGDPNRDAKFVWAEMFLMSDKNILTLFKVVPKICIVYGEDSLLFDSNIVAFCRTHLVEHGIGLVGVPAAAHHVWLDQPMAFIATIRGIFAGWGVAKAPLVTEQEDDDFIRREAALEARL